MVKAHETKTCLLKPIRVEAGLGDPPKEFTTNDAESGNFIINMDCIFIKKSQKFIEPVKEVINTQFRKQDRAVFGKWPYRLCKGFERSSVDDFQRGQLTAQQRLRKVDVFKKATTNANEEFFEDYASQCSSKQGLLFSAKDCKIDKAPLSIL